MKTLHLVCAAHLDPVWMWDWDEGADAALATFYSAVKLSGEYDYIFCHNEAILYEYIECYAPKLFQEIQALVKAGKWHIMGGWYLQPDCTVPSGEAFLRQISVGREFFDEKFPPIRPRR
jgi:alpha-mannosidase